MSRESASATAARAETGDPWDRRPGPQSTAVAAHTHVPADITGLDDYLSSVVGGLLVEGAGIDLTQDSITGAITIAASGGGGGNNYFPGGWA